jgi:hypothetical protein
MMNQSCQIFALQSTIIWMLLEDESAGALFAIAADAFAL